MMKTGEMTWLQKVLSDGNRSWLILLGDHIFLGKFCFMEISYEKFCLTTERTWQNSNFIELIFQEKNIWIALTNH